MRVNTRKWRFWIGVID